MKEISIVAENRPGVLADVTDLMAKNKINIDEIEAETIGNMGVIVMAVQQYDLALKVLRDAGFQAVTEDSLLIKLKDEPGALARIALRFKEANINIRGMHIVRRDSGYSIVAISAERSEEAKKLVKDVLVSK
ncbi:MAG: ACT domain-containing protein [Candidatus Omnitrophica bacterium]|nr:ACT domain-containing protein [Candidatus Omnitrophota bacterium]